MPRFPISRFVSSAAYGAIALLIALAAGWLASLPFRRREPHARSLHVRSNVRERATACLSRRRRRDPGASHRGPLCRPTRRAYRRPRRDAVRDRARRAAAFPGDRGTGARASGGRRPRNCCSALCEEIAPIAGSMPIVYIREGRARDELLALINEEPAISILVLAAGTGPEGPGPLITYLRPAGSRRGCAFRSRSCPAGSAWIRSIS